MMGVINESALSKKRMSVDDKVLCGRITLGDKGSDRDKPFPLRSTFLSVPNAA